MKAAPFSVDFLRNTDLVQPESSTSSFKWGLLPASQLTAHGDLDPPYSRRSIRNVDWLQRELDISRLESIADWLWTAGRPIPPRPLQQQIVLGRSIVATEQTDLHLVTTASQILIKPMPLFLLAPDFWRDHLCCCCSSLSDHAAVITCPPCIHAPTAVADNRGWLDAEAKAAKGAKSREYAGASSSSSSSPSPSPSSCVRVQLRGKALGLLFTYSGLIRHPSDLFLAREKHLLPASITWPQWAEFVAQLLEPSDEMKANGIGNIYGEIHPRYYYGELRLARLNLVYRLRGHMVFGYLLPWQRYGAFVRDYLSFVALGTVFFAIVLGAMQVGIGTKRLQDNEIFQHFATWFSVIAIFVCLGAVVALALLLGCVMVLNWSRTVKYWKKRLSHIDAQKSDPFV